MARRIDKNKAIKMRESGMSYSQIKAELGVSKSTLSLWLRDLPLSDTRLRELRDFNQVRIEKTRLKKQQKRSMRLDSVANKASVDIGTISNRELLIAGFFLYWAEGGKTKNYTTNLSNTDPVMIRAFIKWLALIGGSKEKVYVRLHLYSDMTEKKEIEYWSREIDLPQKQFRKSYIKTSKLSDLTYVTKGHGTCNVIFPGRDVTEYVLQGLKVIARLF
jgi:transposase-like protein